MREFIRTHRTPIVIIACSLVLGAVQSYRTAMIEEKVTPVGEARHAMAQIDSLLRIYDDLTALRLVSDQHRDSMLTLILERIQPQQIKVSTKVEIVADSTRDSAVVIDSTRIDTATQKEEK